MTQLHTLSCQPRVSQITVEHLTSSSPTVTRPLGSPALEGRVLDSNWPVSWKAELWLVDQQARLNFDCQVTSMYFCQLLNKEIRI